MSTIVTVPAEIVNPLRNAARHLLSQTGQNIAAIASTPSREIEAERYHEHLEHLKHTYALLDLIGWNTTPRPTALQIALREHKWSLISALEVMLVIADGELHDLEAVETRRAMRNKPSIREATIAHAHAQHEFAAAVKELADL